MVFGGKGEGLFLRIDVKKKETKKDMKTTDFEKAIDALGVQGLEILEMKCTVGSGVRECYAKMGELVWLKWDESGRGFRFDQEEDIEGCISSDHAAYLDYRRDKDFDLKFD